MNTDFLVDEDELGILSQKRIKREIKTYNRALLFNRKELNSLRQKGLETIRRFSEGKVKLASDISGLSTYDECDLMDSYIKVFGRHSDDVRKSAYVELNRVAPIQHDEHKKSLVSRAYDWRSRKIYKFAKSRWGKRLQSVAAIFFSNKSDKVQNKTKLANQEAMRQQKAEEQRRKYAQMAEQERKNEQLRQQKAAELQARRQQKEAEHQARQQQKAAERQARQQQKENERQARRQQKKIKASNQQPNPKRSRTKAFLLTAFIGLTGVAGIFGIGKLAKDGQNKEKSDNIKIAMIDSVRNDTSKDTISAILANKQSYLQQTTKSDTVTQDTAKPAQAKKAVYQSKKVAKTPVKTKKVVSQSKKVSDSTAVVEDLVLLDTMQNHTPQSDNVMSDTISIADMDTISVSMPDTAISQDSTIILSDSIDLAEFDSSSVVSTALEIDSISTISDSVVNFDTIQSLPVENIASTENILNDTAIVSITDSVTVEDSLQTTEQHYALTKTQARHIKECDSVLSVVCGGAAQRDSLYNQMVSYIDAGNVKIPTEMHLSDFTASIVYWSVSSDPAKRDIGQKVLNGQKITVEQQVKVDSMERWNSGIPMVIKGLGVSGIYTAPLPANNDNTYLNDTTTTSKVSKITKSRRLSNNTSLKEYKPRTQEAQNLLQKLYNSNRLYRRAR